CSRVTEMSIGSIRDESARSSRGGAARKTDVGRPNKPLQSRARCGPRGWAPGVGCLGSNVKSLGTARPRFVPLAPADFEPLYAVYSEPEVSRHLLTQPRSRDEFRRPFEQMLESSSTLGMWMIVDKADNRSIGRCGFYPFSEPPVGTPELAYLLSRAYWSR